MESSLDLVLSALADPTRRALVERLAAGEAKVTDLAAPFDMSLEAVSKHIRRLEYAGLVTRRRFGRVHLIALEPAPLGEAVAWMDRQRAGWTARLDAIDAVLSTNKKGRKR